MEYQFEKHPRRLAPYPSIILSLTLLISGSALAVDSDEDGVPDETDYCCYTPTGLKVDAQGQPMGDLNLDCRVDHEDFALHPRPIQLDEFALVQRNFTGSLPPDGPCFPLCDENVGEFAMPAGAASSNLGAPPNDACADAICIGIGTLAFDTTGATRDGPTVPSCAADGDNQVSQDIWYCHRAICTGTVVAGLCGSEFDTKMAVYEGCDCPVGPLLRCDDDGCGTLGGSSRAVFEVQAGEHYLIRVGGFGAEEGIGLLTVYCEDDPFRGTTVCGTDAGDCFASNGTPACDDEDCCRTVCEIDPFCCDVEWDDICVQETDGRCTGFAVCETSNVRCCSTAGPPGTGCNDSECCNAVCQIDDDCCRVEWDAVCLELANEHCEVCQAP